MSLYRGYVIVSSFKNYMIEPIYNLSLCLPHCLSVCLLVCLPACLPLCMDTAAPPAGGAAPPKTNTHTQQKQKGCAAGKYAYDEKPAVEVDLGVAITKHSRQTGRVTDRQAIKSYKKLYKTYMKPVKKYKKQ